MRITHWLRVVHLVAVLISYWNAAIGLIVVISSSYCSGLIISSIIILIISSITFVHIEKSKGLCDADQAAVIAARVKLLMVFSSIASMKVGIVQLITSR